VVADHADHRPASHVQHELHMDEGLSAGPCNACKHSSVTKT
jgi:hypothetical protein